MDEVNAIINDILFIEKRKLDSLLSVCKSPIEKIYLVNFLKYYWNASLDIYNISYLYLSSGSYNISNPNYPAEKSTIVGTVGGSYIYGVRIQEKTLGTIIEIAPQYEVKGQSGFVYLDFAIFVESYNWKTKAFEKIKFFVECDGHEFHSAADKIEKDNIRANLLKSAGWIEFRYSGRTINRSGFDAATNLENYIKDVLKPDYQVWD